MAVYAPQNIADRSQSIPITISQSEYDEVWKPAGWKIIVIGPTSTWREEWGEWEAIRDIVQNCLDEAEKYYYGYDEDGLWIADNGKGVAVADFLLGPPKLKPDWARGKFGEGMKIACLALLRKGHPVYVETVKRKLWIVFMEQPVNGKVKTLAALWKADGSRVGTKFHIIGYKGTAFEQRFSVNLPSSDILAAVPAPVTKPIQRYNQLIRAEGMAKSAAGGVIYCRDIYLMDIMSPFSYNLWGFELAPDRHGPKHESDMYTDMGRLWSGIKSVPLLAEFIGMVTERARTRRTIESRYVIMSFMGREPTSDKLYEDIMYENARYWKEAWVRAVGKNTVLQLDRNLDRMVNHLGYESVSVQYGLQDAFARVIKTDKELVREMASRLAQAEIIDGHQLTPPQLAHLNLARAIAGTFSATGPVDAAVIPPASDAVQRTAGLYEFETAAIKIHVEMLKSASKTVEVMVHELGHHVAYQRTGDKALAGDLTVAHASAMEFVAGEIFRNLSQGRYNDVLTKVTWYG
ncbi:MAG: hypothetical protein ACUVTR_02035 [Dehalococcoidia bacterium]